MNISSPNLPGHIKKSLSNIIEELNQSGLADRNADLEIDVLGVLSYTIGAKLRLSYIDDINDQDICEWNHIARQNGAVNVTSRVNTNKGQIQLNIEYKSVQHFSHYDLPLTIVHLNLIACSPVMPDRRNKSLN